MGWLHKKPAQILGSILVLTLLAFLAVKIFLPAEKIRDLALEQVRARLGREVTVGDVGLSFRDGLGVILNDFIVHNPEGFAGAALAETRALDLKLEIKPLFKGEVRVARLVLDEPRVRLVTLPDSSNNYTFAQTETASGGDDDPKAADPAEAAFSIDKFAIVDGLLILENAGQETRFEGVNGSLRLTDPAPGQYRIIGDLRAEQILLPQVEPVFELPAKVRYELLWDDMAQTLAITSLSGELAHFPLQCAGQVQVTDVGPTTQLQLQTKDLDLARFWNFARPLIPADQKGELAGHADLELNLEVPPDADLESLEYSGKASMRQVSYTQTELVDELKQMDAELEFTQDRYSIVKSDLEFGSGKFHLTGYLQDPLPYFLPPTLQGDGPITKPHLEFTLNAESLDVDRLMPAASPTGGESEPAAGGTQTKTLDLEFPDLTARGSFVADELVYMEVPFTRVQGQVQVAKRILAVTDVAGEVYDGALTAEVAIDLNDMNDPVYEGHYQARQIQVDGFVSHFVGAHGLLLGLTDMTGRFATHGLDPEVIKNNLTLDSDAALTDGRLITRDQIRGTLGQLAEQTGQTLGGEQALRNLATHITVADGKVGFDELSTKLGQWGDLNFGGTYALSGALDYQGTLLLTAAQTDKLFSGGVMNELAKLLGDERPERLALPLSVGGTRRNPQIKLDLGAATGDLQQKALDAQKNKLEDKAKNEIKKGLGDLLNKWK